MFTRRGKVGVVAWLACACLELCSVPARAWVPSGHMQIALRAYALLPEPTRRDLDALLRQHPRYETDFVPHIPAGLGTDAERARWVFAYAATWPDLVRGQPEYEHGSWHYVNLPLYLHAGALVTCKQARADFPASVRRVAAYRAAHPAPAGRASATPPAAPVVADSILEALPRMRRTFEDASLLPSERALALSWILHLVGDAHQPLHGVALFTERSFPIGDRGGNDVVVTGRGNLHALWDGLLGEDTTFDVVERGAAAHVNPDPRAQSAAANLDVDAWIDEGCRLARSYAYVPAVTSAVRELERAGREGKPEVSLGPAYVAAATRVARQRAVQAATRLVALLSRVRSP
jgi:S1/P1 Nuclease